jgi:hypothetical protein
LTPLPECSYNAQGLILLCGFASDVAQEVLDAANSCEECTLRSYSFLGGYPGDRLPAVSLRDPRFRRMDL